MAWAVFKKNFNWHRPKSAVSFSAEASPDPQERPKDFIEQAVARGFAEEVEAPTKEEKAALKAKTEQETVSAKERAEQVEASGAATAKGAPAVNRTAPPTPK
jgi:hypothetical protein